MRKQPQPVSQEDLPRKRRIAPTLVRGMAAFQLPDANPMSLGGTIRDPIKYRHRLERFSQRGALQEKYGAGTMADVKRRYRENRFENPTAAQHYQGQIMARLQEGFTGRGRYKRRSPRGRGMYTSGMVGRGRYRGRGSFWSKLRKGTAATARWGAKHMDAAMPYVQSGLAMTGPQGMAAAAALRANQSNIKKGLSAIGGRGAYNTLFPELGPEPVSFDTSHSEHGNLCVSGSEKVFDVYGNSLLPGQDLTLPMSQLKCDPFTTIAVDLYPGNFEHFPKLAQHAADFKEYEYVQLIFVYKSTIAANWSTEAVTTGKIIMATQMDVNRPVWSTYDELAAVENKTEGLVTGTTDDDRMHTHGVECDPGHLTKKGLKFVRTKGLTGDADKSDYDLGRFQFGMFGSGANLADQMIGELWVQYKVVFKNHRMYSMLGLNIPQSIWRKPLDIQLGPATSTGVAIYKDTWPTIMEMSDSNKCDFNNLDILMERTSIIDMQSTISANEFLGQEYLITFPSNLRGDYELEFMYVGERLLVNDGSQFGSTSGISENAVKGFYYEPTLTGTVGLNRDIPLTTSTDSSSTSSSADQSTMKFCASTSSVSLTYHVHLGQATSTQENSMTVFIPFYLEGNSAASQLASENSAQVFRGSAITFKQYNANQIIGSAGFPYSSLN